jgi:acid phosphatase
MPSPTVVFIIMENKSLSQVVGSSNFKYFNSLIAGTHGNCASTSAYCAIGHPSTPNYLALTGGNAQHYTDSYTPAPYSQASIANLLESKGVTWGVYAENFTSATASIPGSAFGSLASWESNPNVDQGNAPAPQTTQLGYAQRHNPFGQYSQVFGNPAWAANVHDYAQYVPGREQFQFIIPDLYDDGHTAAKSPLITSSPVATDTWLSNNLPAILTCSAFAPGTGSVCWINWDEASGGNNGPTSPPANQVACIAVGPGAKAGFTSSQTYTHYSLLATWEFMLGLGNLGQNDVGALVMHDMLGTSTGTTDNPTWTSGSTTTQTFTPSQSGVIPIGFNTSTFFGAVSSETFSPTAPSTGVIINPAIACGTQQLSQTTLL